MSSVSSLWKQVLGRVLTDCDVRKLFLGVGARAGSWSLLGGRCGGSALAFDSSRRLVFYSL